MTCFKITSLNFIVLLFLMVCIQKSLASENYEVLTFSRSACFGSCPTYSVDFYSDGLMVFKGKKYTSFIGIKRIQLNPELFISLKTTFKEATSKPIDYFGCKSFATDHPTVTITLLESGKYSAAEHNYGCTGYEGEKRLLQLVEKVQKMLPINEWIKKKTSQ